MANITLLHWNIQAFSTKKLNNLNGQALIDYIARIVARSGANIISLLEIKNSAVIAVGARLIPAINIATAAVGPNKWRSVSIDNRKNGEAYLVLWKLGNNFDPLLPTGGRKPINGLTNQKLIAGLTPGGNLNFPQGKLQSGGRKPYYVTFETRDTHKFFSVIAYHAMFGYWTGVGVRNIGRLAQSRAILDDNITLDMDASLTTGDFNVNFDSTNPGDYNIVLNNLPSSQSTNELTSLKNRTPPHGYPNSVQYRANAYDNIFKYDRAGVPPVGGGIVPDLINESTTLPVGDGAMEPQAGAFVRGPIPQGQLIQNIPPQDFEDSWHIVRHAISDHYPVYVTVAI